MIFIWPGSISGCALMISRCDEICNRIELLGQRSNSEWSSHMWVLFWWLREHWNGTHMIEESWKLNSIFCEKGEKNSMLQNRKPQKKLDFRNISRCKQMPMKTGSAKTIGFRNELFIFHYGTATIQSAERMQGESTDKVGNHRSNPFHTFRLVAWLDWEGCIQECIREHFQEEQNSAMLPIASGG